MLEGSSVFSVRIKQLMVLPQALKKTEAIKGCPTPKSVKELRGFLGLAGYYRKSIRGFDIINKSLIDLLKNIRFQLSVFAEEAFN